MPFGLFNSNSKSETSSTTENTDARVLADNGAIVSGGGAVTVNDVSGEVVEDALSFSSDAFSKAAGVTDAAFDAVKDSSRRVSEATDNALNFGEKAFDVASDSSRRALDAVTTTSQGALDAVLEGQEESYGLVGDALDLVGSAGSKTLDIVGNALGLAESAQEQAFASTSGGDNLSVEKIIKYVAIALGVAGVAFAVTRGK